MNNCAQDNAKHNIMEIIFFNMNMIYVPNITFLHRFSHLKLNIVWEGSEAIFSILMKFPLQILFAKYDNPITLSNHCSRIYSIA